MPRASRSAQAATSSRSPPTTATCCSTSARGIPCTGIEPTASTAAAARQLGIEVSRNSSAKRWQSNWPPGPAGRPDGGQQRATPTCRTSTTSPPASPSCSNAGRGVTFEFPHLMRLVETTSSTPSTTSISPTCRSAPSAASSRPPASRVRRGGTAHPRRQPARVRCQRADDAAAATAAASMRTRCWRKNPGRRFATPGYLRRLPGAGGPVKERPARFPDPDEARRQKGRRLRRGGQGQHPAQLRRRQARPDALRLSTAIPPSRASSCRAAIPVLPPDTLRPSSGRTTC
jgi:hypothetical protein